MKASSPRTDAAEPDAEGCAAKRLLILKLGAIGDVIMTIPAAAAMRVAGYSVDWVAGEAVAPILALYPWIRVVPVDESKLMRGSLRERLGSVLELWRTLRRQSAERGPYDLCATLYYDRRYRLLTLPARARRRIRLSRQNRASTLLPGRQHTAEYSRILSGRPDAEAPGQLAPVRPIHLPACSRPPETGRGRIVLVPAGARNLLRENALRRWPIEHYVAVADELLAQGFEILLVGGPEDRWASPFFATLRNTSPPGSFSDLIGELTLVETLSLLDSAAVTVTHDTGPLHMAGITSSAIVAIFGPTAPYTFLPQRENCIALWGGEGFACRPCYDGRDFAPCEHNGCMAQVTPSMVLAQIEVLMKARADGRSIMPQVLTPSHAGLIHIEAGTTKRGG